jgi:hypothetical protein
VISVQEVVLDPDMIAPQPFVILRSVGEFIAGSFQTTTTPITMFGPVQQASNKEIQMLPEADRVGSIRAFWSTIPVLLTRGTAPVPSVHGEVAVGTTPGTTFTLSEDPPEESLTLIVNGLFMTPGVDYTIDGPVITLVTSTNVAPYAQWPVTANVQQAASDIIQFPPGGEKFRVLQRYYDPGGGYWKALGTRMNAA